MENTVENSPYHREKNVAEHTRMTVANAYVNLHSFLIRDESDTIFYDIDKNVLSIALLFHDVGKPQVKEVIERGDGTSYNRFGGHEQRSARLFNEYFFNNIDQFSEFSFSKDQLYFIQWLIEHHLPYGDMKSEKYNNFVKEIVAMADKAQVNPNIFFAHLLSDNKGRTPDPEYNKTEEVIAWIKVVAATYKSFKATPAVIETSPYVTIIVGPSGAGKSTLVNECVKSSLYDGEKYALYSLDTLRLALYAFSTHLIDINSDGIASLKDTKTINDWFKTMQFELTMNMPDVNYNKAYEFAVDHSSIFSRFADLFLSYVFGLGCNIIIDNVNASKKSRAKYVNIARQRGYSVYCEYIMCSLSTVLASQKTRLNKEVPAGAVRSQYFSISLPSEGGEFDHLNISVRYS